MMVPDDEAQPRRLRLPLWAYRGALVFLAVTIVAPIVYVIIFYNVMARAATADRLAAENKLLQAGQVKMHELEQSLLQTRQLVASISNMAGLDSAVTSSLYNIAPPKQMTALAHPPTIKRTQPLSSVFPEGLPVAGWISRGYNETPGRRHEGIDLAIPEGTPVLATGAGTVLTAGTDDIFGEMVVVQNNDSIKTIYGHNSKLLVKAGDTILAGKEIALSGNTGKSTAPHLHYEIRINDKPVNPLTNFIYEVNTQ
jgi:murein DD-endopeptidase MepM/ murein hydrolase activator NlpD